MSIFLVILLGASLVALLVVLAMGVINIGKRDGQQRSNQLMRWRVILQFFVILVALALFLVLGSR